MDRDSDRDSDRRRDADRYSTVTWILVTRTVTWTVARAVTRTLTRTMARTVTRTVTQTVTRTVARTLPRTRARTPPVTRRPPAAAQRGGRRSSDAQLHRYLRLDSDGRRVLFISGLQGPALPVGTPEIVPATRTLDALRPKRATLEAAYALARWLKVDAIVAIAKANHMSTGQGRRWRDIRAEYDEFWSEFDPEILPDGDYLMPATLPQRDISEVAAKKRKEWQNRTARLEALAADVTTALDALAASTGDLGSGEALV